MRSASHGIAVAMLAALILSAQPASGQTAEPVADTPGGWHIVRQGDNLMLIARDYLGSKTRWREILKLNPQIAHPDFLNPGERLRIPLSPEARVPSARLLTLSGRVDDKPDPLPWLEAREEDLLRVQDGIRTFDDSSTEMEFEDGTRVLLTEDSLVYVRNRRSREPAGGAGESREVEIVEGQADIETAATLSRALEIEIVVAGVTARPQSGDQGSQTRARAAASGGAELMVYEGSSEVEAAGEKVAVASGMGTAVPAEGPPSAPEKLLPAASPLAPGAGSEWQLADPLFRWRPVAEAVSYTLEVCSDPACAALVRRVTGIETSQVRLDPLPVVPLFWRVTAVSASGLDGYSSPVSAFAILTDQRDETPPSGRISLSGAGSARGEKTFRARTAVVSVTVEDDGSGLASWTPRVNGEAVEPSRLAGPWPSGEHTVAVTAVDWAGNRAELAPLTFLVDADPPRLDVEVRWVAPFLRQVRAGVASRRWLRSKRRFAAWAAEQPGVADRGFLVIAAGSDTTPVEARHPADPFARDPSRLEKTLQVTGDRPQAIVLASGVVPPGPEGPVTDGRFLWIRARDEAVEVERLSVTAAEGELVIEAEDALSNRARLALPLR